MEITIITGQRNADLQKFYEDNYKNFGGILLVFPEAKACHTYDLTDSIAEIVQMQINNSRDLIVLTYSEVVLNAIMLQVARNEFENTKCLNLLDDGGLITAKINKYGDMDNWVDGVFDIDKVVLRELRTIKNYRTF